MQIACDVIVPCDVAVVPPRRFEALGTLQQLQRAATARPRPSAVGISVWVTMPWRPMASCARTWPCWAGGKTSMMRSTVCGALLVWSGIKLMHQGDAEIDPEKNLILQVLRRWMPVTDDYVGNKFWVRQPNLHATPLVVVLLVVETTDILFAVDSIPAVLAITLNAFIVYTSNVFAIMGLRSMYFALAGVMDYFEYLHYGLSAVLIFIGTKMLMSHYYKIPTHIALGTVIGVLAISVAASLIFPRKNRASE